MAMARPRASHVQLLVLLAVSLDVAHGKPEPAAGKVAEFFRLDQHSFEKTLTYDSGLQHWLASAGTMALRDRVQVMPPVPDRHGLFWSKKAVETRDFELLVSLKGTSGGDGARDGYFAIWISPEDFVSAYDEQAIVSTSRNWTEGLSKVGLTFAGSRPSFRGLGLFFLASDENGKARESVVAMWSDGSKTSWSLDDVRRGTPAPPGSMKVLKWLTEEMLVKVRVKGDGSISGLIVKKADQDKTDAVEMFTMPPGTATNEKSFFGFSSWSGSQAHIELDLTSVETRNFDVSKNGEASVDASYGNVEAWRKMLEAEKRYVSQASQMEAVKRLTTLLGDHVATYTSLGTSIKGDVAKLEQRLDNLGQDFGKLVAETEAFDFKTGVFNTDTVKEHIQGIHTILQKGKDLHDSKLAEVHSVAKDLRAKGGAVMGEVGKQKVQSVADQAKILEEHAARGSTQTSGLLLVMVLAVAGLGLLFLNRMRYYEKKHYI